MDYSRLPGETDDRAYLNDRAFNRKSFEERGHVSPFDRARLDVGVDRIAVRLVQGINEADFRAVAGRAVRATNGIDPEAPVEDYQWEELLKGGLQTALESQVVVFEVSGVSRATTHQLVRSRRAAFHQQSQRATYMGQHPDMRIPESIWRDDEVTAAYLMAIDAAHWAYNKAVDADIAYQDARYILPEGTEAYIVMEYPLREFLAVYAYRACVMFQFEFVYIMRECRRLLVEAHPWLDPYIKISCEKTSPDPALRKCTFMGWEAVDEQCDFEWGREDNRTYKPAAELKIEKKPVP